MRSKRTGIVQGAVFCAVFALMTAFCGSVSADTETTTAGTETTTHLTETTATGTGTTDGTADETTTSSTTTTTVTAERTDPMSRFKFQTLDDGTVKVKEFRWETDEEVVAVPSEYEGKPVTVIGSEAFKYCYASQISLPVTITEIEDAAFEGCAWLTTMAIPQDCARIGSRAFADCDRLSAVTIPLGVREIGEAAFDGTPFLEDQTAAMVVLGDGILYRCNGTGSELTIPDTVKVIAARACAGNTELKKLTLSDTVTSIGAGAFADCEALSEITLPHTLSQLAPDAFAGTKWEKSREDALVLGNILYQYRGTKGEMTLPEGVEIINTAACKGLASLTTVKLPDSVKEVRSEAFADCTSLQVVMLGESLREIGDNAFSGCSTLKYLRVGHELTTIGDHAFVGCPYLEEVYLPDTVRAIGEKALGYSWSDIYKRYTKLKNSLVIYANAQAAKDYAAAEEITVEPLPMEENTNIPPEVTTIAGEGENIGTPRGTAWIPAMIIGGILVLIGLIGFFTRKRS